MTDWTDHIGDDSGAHMRREERDGRMVALIVLVVVALLALLASSCATGTGGRAFGARAAVALGAPDVADSGAQAPQAGAYAAKGFRVVLVTRAADDGAPEPLAGETVIVWDQAAMRRIEITTDSMGAAWFSCRCQPTVFVRGVRVDADPQPSDVLPNQFSLLVEVR